MNATQTILSRTLGAIVLVIWFSFVFKLLYPQTFQKLSIRVNMELFQTNLFLKMLKFGIVGLSGMCIDFSITWVCKEKVKLNKYIANTIGFSVAVVNNFFLNYIWTFKGVNSIIPSAFGLFALFAIIGLILNNLFVYLFHGLGSLNFYPSKLLAIVGVFIWNFSYNYFFNFHS